MNTQEITLRKAYKEFMQCTPSKVEGWWKAIKDADKAIVKKIVDEKLSAERRLKQFCDGFYFKTKIRKYVSEYLYTDVRAYEVVRVISPISVEIRKLDTKIKVAPKEFYPGGFVGHYADNHAQEWEYTSNVNNPTERLRLSKKGWGKGRFLMHDEPYKFHDYNF